MKKTAQYSLCLLIVVIAYYFAKHYMASSAIPSDDEMAFRILMGINAKQIVYNTHCKKDQNENSVGEYARLDELKVDDIGDYEIQSIGDDHELLMANGPGNIKLAQLIVKIENKRDYKDKKHYNRAQCNEDKYNVFAMWPKNQTKLYSINQAAEFKFHTFSSEVENLRLAIIKTHVDISKVSGLDRRRE